MDNAQLTKIEALLAKAEATQFEDEAAAFIAKAQALMVKYSIDEAMLDAARVNGRTSEPVSETITLGKPRARNLMTFAALLDGIAKPNNVRVVLAGGPSTAHLVGFPGDIARVRMLYASLLVQMLGHEAEAAKTAYYRHRTSHKASFYVGWVNRVIARIQEAANLAKQDHAAASGAGTELVLASREERVSAAFVDLFPHVRAARRGGRVSDPAAYASGSAAGNRAALSGSGSVSAGSRGHAIGA